MTEMYLRKYSKEKDLRTMLEDVKINDLIPVDEVKSLARVNLITPEHIHLNSFMYEPLIDLDSEQLISLYSTIIDITKE